MTYALYYSPGACSLAPHIVLEELDVPFSPLLISTSDGSTQSADYLRVNPKGRVPVLVFGESILTEAPAILLYLAAANPDANLMPSSPLGMARCVEWFNWLSGTVHAVAVRQIWRPENFISNSAQFSDIAHKGRENIEAAFSYIEARMIGALWAVGEHYSVVDPYLLVFYRWGNRLGFDMRNRYSAWTQHALRLMERPAVQRAMSQESISLWG